VMKGLSKVMNHVLKVKNMALKVIKAKAAAPHGCSGFDNQLFLGSNGLTGPSFCAGLSPLSSFATIFEAISP
jgi:hypothetical protein